MSPAGVGAKKILSSRRASAQKKKKGQKKKNRAHGSKADE
jgi:hypothetical protein